MTLNYCMRRAMFENKTGTLMHPILQSLGAECIFFDLSVITFYQVCLL